MNKNIQEQLLALAHEKRDQVFGNSQQREFECLIAMIENDDIVSFEELAEYGVKQ
jgi:hypothetical protein